MQIFQARAGSVLQIHISHPPVNALSVGAGVVGALHAALQRAEADEAITAVILAGDSGLFSAGADIADFDGAPERLDAIRALVEGLEAMHTPVIASIEGLCLGGGLELALAAHMRIAAPDAKFGFPEITLGLLPGGGGTQRLPRLVGAEAAIDLMMSGKTINADRAARLGIIDEVSDHPIERAHQIIDDDAIVVRRSGRLPAPPDITQRVADTRTAGTHSDAQLAILKCVDAVSLNDLGAGLAIEADLFGKLMQSPASKALRHGFFGRRMVGRIPGVSKGDAAKISKVTVVGGGLMGSGIALALVNAGLDVTVVEQNEAARSKSLEGLKASIQRDFGKGRISADAAEARVSSLRVADTIAAASDADLFIEAVFEDIDVKRQVFQELDRAAPEHAILASNTSTLDLNAIAAFTSRPDRVVGLHFFSPANIMRLLEIVRGSQTSAATLASAMAFAKAIRKTGVVAGVCDGFIGNRVFEEYLRQAWFLLEEGALPQQIDRALETWGMAMGPCRVMDLAGQDIGWSIRKRRAVEQPDRPYSKVPDLICELGRFGQKSGAGFYRYPDGRTAEIDPSVEPLIVAESDRLGLTRRVISDDEIVERCVLAMANEGAKIVEEGVAYRPVDVDIIYLDGYGFPAARGGPMFTADQIGLSDVLSSIKRYAAGRHGWAWAPAQLLVDLVGRDASFESLNI